MQARETDTWQCPRIFTRNIHQQYRTTDSRHHTVTQRAREFKPQLCLPATALGHWFTYFPPQHGFVGPQSPGRPRPPSGPTPSLSPGAAAGMLTILSLPRWKVSPCQNRRL